MNYTQILRTASKRLPKLEKANELLTAYLNDWEQEARAQGKMLGYFFYATKQDRDTLNGFIQFEHEGKGGAVPLHSKEDFALIRTLYNAKQLKYGKYQHTF